MCIRITKAVNGTLFRYNEGTEASLPLPLVAKYGNAVWLALVSAVRTLPFIVDLITADDKDLPPDRHRVIWDQDICTTGQIRNRFPCWKEGYRVGPSAQSIRDASECCASTDLANIIITMEREQV
jgi:hypothetical protein